MATHRISIDRVLCPIDFSDISQHALAHAAAIAHWYEARLTVLFVFASLPSFDLPPVLLEESDRARLLTQMQSFAAVVPAGVPVDYQIEEAGLVHDAIVEQVDATQADMLVLGTHGRSGFQRLFLGSVTEKVMRKVTCPVLIVPPRAPGIPVSEPVHFHRILCPIDFSGSSLTALEYATSLAGEADGQLTALHVLEAPSPGTLEPLAADEFIRARETAAQDAGQRLDDLIPPEARAYCTVSTVVVEGRAYPEILRHAVEKGIELIVMGVQGRGALDLLLFGSTTHHVIRAAQCPVLIVRPGDKSDA